MSNFTRYQHVAKMGNLEVANIQEGLCHVFPKIDGANSSVWWEDEDVQAGSRKRHLSTFEDNHGFCVFAKDDPAIHDFLFANQSLRVYGEWLVPHTMKTYRDDAWRKFYVFDVVDEDGRYLSYEEYQPLLEQHNLVYIPCIGIVKNGTNDQFFALAQSNDYLMQPGEIGEGIVIKNYEYTNKFGRVNWSKFVRSEFREKNAKSFGPPVIEGTLMTEQQIVRECITKTLVDKELAKIQSDLEAANEVRLQAGLKPSPIQPRILGIVWHCLLTEEIPDQVKKRKNPVIDFRLLNRLTIHRVKELLPDLF